MEEYRFLQSFQKLFSYSTITFVGFVESRETSESEPSTFVHEYVLKAIHGHAVIIQH